MKPIPTFKHPTKGNVMTYHDLPAKILRWSPQKKAMLLTAIGHSVIDESEVMKRYNVSRDELEGWRKAYTRVGVKGLKATTKSNPGGKHEELG